MPIAITLCIPSTTTCQDPKPHTLYNIVLTRPLQSTTTLQKRYSDFTALHDTLVSQANAPPPLALPPKTWLGSSSTVNNPQLAEERRLKLESYVQAIQYSADPRWRNTSGWRAFLNLPAQSSASSSSSSLVSASNSTLPQSSSSAAVKGSSPTPVTDPHAWLTAMRTLKRHLHSARLSLISRDQATTPLSIREASAAAKGELVRANTVLSSLESGLRILSQPSPSNSINNYDGRAKIGEGELRRRKDLITGAKMDLEGLEKLLVAGNLSNDRVSSAEDASSANGPASRSDREKLLHASSGTLPASGRPRTGRVLGRETDKTRPLDNHGLLQLQTQIMNSQDQDVEDLRKNVSRMKNLGVQINEELEIQNSMLDMFGEDIDRVNRKVGVAKKRLHKIS